MTPEELAARVAGPASWRDDVEEHTAPVTATDLALLADTLDGPAAGEWAPPMWAGAVLAGWPAHRRLGADGHPVGGVGYPPLPERRRLFAGARWTFTGGVAVGSTATRRTRVVRVEPKVGRTGAMVFVTLRHDYVDDTGVVAASEEQDLAYRSGAMQRRGGDASGAPAQEAGTDAAGELRLHADRVRLFRFSSLTRNSHRIHYDEGYATGVEGLPGLIVHGPLLALFALELPRRLAPERVVAAFSFRLARPVTADAQLVARAPEQGEGRWTVEVGDGTATALVGEVEFEEGLRER